MLSASVDIRVRYEETDKMGVVYHSNYFIWFEVARVALLDELGCPYSELEKDGFFLPVLKCDANFKLPAVFDDRLKITVRIEKLPVARIEASYDVKRGDILLATGSTQHAFVSCEGKVVRPPDSFLEIAKQYFSD